jgi:hypothetical protein
VSIWRAGTLSQPGGTVVEGPYTCTYQGCDCKISQTSHMYGIDEHTFNQAHLPTLDAYGQHEAI